MYVYLCVCFLFALRVCRSRCLLRGEMLLLVKSIFIEMIVNV
jgi:hypothetical protein